MISAERPSGVDPSPPPVEAANPPEAESAGLRPKPSRNRLRFAYVLAAMIALGLGLGIRRYLESEAAVEAAGMQLYSVLSRGSLKSAGAFPSNR